MIERIARVISGAPFPSERSLAKARAVLKELREPTPEMCSASFAPFAGMKPDNVLGPDEFRAFWQAAIDKALDDA